MVDKINGLQIKGKCFLEETFLQFFPGKSDRLSIVYGKNGTGKSTISSAFSHIATKRISDSISANLIDRSCNYLELDQSERIVVFNEAFIDENVKIDDDALGTIVLLGKQVGLQSKIDAQIEIVEEAKKGLDAATAYYEQFSALGGVMNPDYYFAQIRSKLQEGWSATDAIIRRNKIKSRVTDEIIREIGTMVVPESISSLQEQFEETQKLLNQVSDTTISYPHAVQAISLSAGFESELCKTLSQKIDQPILTEREEKILAIVESGRQSMVEDSRVTFSDPKNTVCPYCLSVLSEEYRYELIQSINKVLNKDVDEHIELLTTYMFPNFDAEYDSYLSLDAKLVQEIQAQIIICKRIISQYRAHIEAKKGNVYTPICILPLGLETAISKLNSLLEALEKKRTLYLEASKKKGSLLNQLVLINKKIAHLQISDLYSLYIKQLNERGQAQKQCKTLDAIFSDSVGKLKGLEQEKADVGLAISAINSALDYVFFARGRLSIELRKGKYFLKSNGKDVRPKDISVGERNIIALCYFFTQILSNQDVDRLYEEQELVVIDDPISSFDFENKIGISSFLRYQTFNVLKGNYNSKILYLTHDLGVFFDLLKIADEIQKSVKIRPEDAAVKCTAWELESCKLVARKNPGNEYQKLLREVYQYATDPQSSSELSIGNIMRRVLESFSTFMYATGIEEVSLTTTVLHRLGERSDYFENLMYRLVLNGESHFRDRIYSIQSNFNFFDFISSEEKKRTCKDILSFIYCLNPDHILAHLSQKAASEIESWVDQIPLNDQFKAHNKKAFRIIPLYDFPLSAGTGAGILDETIPHQEFKTSNKKCDFALKISGDSMEPEIPNGSIVLIRKQDVVSPEEIGAFCLNGEGYCKRLSIVDGKTFLHSDNSKYEPIEVFDSDSLIVYGVVVEIIS